MPGIVDVPGVEAVGKNRAEFQLPCGAMTPDGKVHKRVILRETTGYEEDILGDDTVIRSTRMSDVLSACVTQIGTVTDKDMIRRMVIDDMPTGGVGITSTDRIAAMIFLRRVSVGDVYKFDRRCPRVGCGFLNKNKRLDLRTIAMTTVPEDRVGKRRVKFPLPRSGQKATLRVLTAKYEEELFKLRPTQKELASAAMCARIESIGDVTFTDPSRAMTAVKELPQEDRNTIRAVYNKIEADVDTMIQVTCGNPICGAEFEFALDVGQSFFSNPVDEDLPSEMTWL